MFSHPNAPSRNSLASRIKCRSTSSGPVLGKLEVPAKLFSAPASLVQQISELFTGFDKTSTSYQPLINTSLDSNAFDGAFIKAYREANVVPLAVVEHVLERISSENSFFPRETLRVFLSQRLIIDSLHPTLLGRVLDEGDSHLIINYLDHCLDLSESAWLRLAQFLFKVSKNDSVRGSPDLYATLLSRLLASRVDSLHLCSASSGLDLELARWLLAQIEASERAVESGSQMAPSSEHHSGCVWLEAILVHLYKNFELLGESDAQMLRRLHTTLSQESQCINAFNALRELVKAFGSHTSPTLQANDTDSCYRVELINL